MLGLRWPFRRKRATSPTPCARGDDTPAPYTVAEVLHRFVSPDGRRRADIIRRHNGFFAFHEEEEEREDEYGGLYWLVVRASGLYATQAEALKDADAEIPWLRDSLTHTPS